MKTVKREISMRIHYSMTFEEASLIHRMTHGYVALARYLAGVADRFPEEEEKLSKMLSSLTNGIGEEIQKSEDARDVHSGKKVAIDHARLNHLEEIAAKWSEREKKEKEAALKDMQRDEEE